MRRLGNITENNKYVVTTHIMDNGSFETLVTEMPPLTDCSATLYRKTLARVINATETKAIRGHFKLVNEWGV